MKLSKSDGDKYLQAQSFLNSKSKVENEKGIHVIAELVKDYPCLGKLRAVYANALWDRGDIEIATKEFQQAILFSPKSKIVSLGLFHCLWDQGKESDAFEEMARLTKLGVRCTDYEDIVREINDKW